MGILRAKEDRHLHSVGYDVVTPDSFTYSFGHAPLTRRRQRRREESFSFKAAAICSFSRLEAPPPMPAMGSPPRWKAATYADSTGPCCSCEHRKPKIFTAQGRP